jgi:hypothetical protein
MSREVFFQLTKSYFSFLESSFSFVPRQCAERRMVYEREDIFVTVAYDYGRSFELSIDLGRVGKSDEPPFNFGEVLRSANAPSDVAASYEVTSAEVLARSLERLAQSLWRFGPDLLRGEPLAFQRIVRQRETEGVEFANATKLKRARAVAQDAWDRGDYQMVVDTFELLERSLSPSEKKRLEYARKHLR